MEYVLQTDALTKRYRNSQALDGLTMRVAKGEYKDGVLNPHYGWNFMND